MCFGDLHPVCGNFSWSRKRVFYEKEHERESAACVDRFRLRVMTAASVWSLLIPALEQAKPMGKLSFVPLPSAFGGCVVSVVA
jgi:ZIP family zinc transporter